MSSNTPDWTTLAEGLGYANEREMWTALYASFTLKQLSVRFGVTPQGVASAIRKSGVLLQPRGGVPGSGKKRLAQLTLREARELQKEGVAAAARRLNVPYATLYWRVRTAILSAYAKRKARAPSA